MKAVAACNIGMPRQRRTTTATLIFAAVTVIACFASASAASATTSIKLSPDTNHPSGTFKVKGYGFGPTEVVDIYFDSTDERLAVTDGSGNFANIPITVPVSATPGTHWVEAVGRHSGLAAQKQFTVQTDWAQFHFGVQRKGSNPYENVIDPANAANLDVAWSAATQNAIFSSPAVANGNVYVGSDDHKLYAFNATSGALLSGWPVATASYVQSSPAVANGVVYVGSADGNVDAFGLK